MPRKKSTKSMNKQRESWPKSKAFSKKAKKMDDEYKDIRTSAASHYGAPINDIKWYRDNEQLLNDVCRMPYNIPLGTTFFREGTLYQNRTSRWAIPGMCMMNVVPTIGNAKDPMDPVNVAFNGMFTFIRATTSSKFDWDHNTLGIVTFAIDSIYYMTRWMIRCYGTLPLFHQSNKYIPRDVLEAQGIDYDEFLANSAAFRAALNMRIARINALKIPSELYIFARHEWMFENYYIEGPSEKDQMYFYKPAAFYVCEFDAQDKRMLKCHRTEAGGTGVDGRLTTADLIRKLDAMLDPVFNDQDFNLISGYIEQAYQGKVMKIDYVPDQIIVPLIYSEEVLLQFKNAKPMPVRHESVGTGYYDGFFDITQEPASTTDIRLCLKVRTPGRALAVYRSITDGIAVDVDSTSDADIKYNLYATYDEYSKEIMLTSPHATVDPSENMLNTRLVPVIDIFQGSSAPNYAVNFIGFGTEWPISFEIFTRYATGRNSGQSISLSRFELHRVMYWDTTEANSFAIVGNLLPKWSKFRFMPEISIVTRIQSGSVDPTNVGPSDESFFEVDNYTLISHNNVERIHESAILAMLRVPENASTSLSAR